MKIFVIGGTGFISSRLVELLLKAGHEVYIFTRGCSKKQIAKNDRLKVLYGDRNKWGDLKNAIDGNNFDVVYDFVAYQPLQSKICIDVFKNKIGRFIHCSTVSVYMVSGELRCPITEDQAKQPLMNYWPRNPFGMDYGINKRKCEDLLWEYHNEKIFPVSMLRPTFVSGPADPACRDFFWIIRILDGQPLLVPGSGDFAFQQVYVDDAARAFFALSENPSSVGKVYNVASEEMYSLNEYLQKLSRLLNRLPEIVHISQEVFDQLPISTHPYGDVFPFNTQRTATFSLEKIKNDLKFQSTPFEVWMEKTIDWVTSHQSEHSIGYENRGLEVKLLSLYNRERNKFHSHFLKQSSGQSTNVSG